MSDIVERLREYRRADPYRKSALMAAEAADEIESLHSRLVIESKAREALLRENESLRSRLAEEARRHTEQTVELVNLAEGRRVRLAEAEALLRDIYSYAEDQGMETLMDMIDSADSADAAQIVTISEHLDESVNHGWVIEGAWSHVQTPDYWVGSSAWSQDHNRALRFARKQDAEQAAAMMLDGIRVRFCEHAWTARE